MLDFQQKYIEDAGELLHNLEKHLIVFERNANDVESIDEIFRVMHTLKGTSGMFGFSKIERLTHVLEDLYDAIRNRQIQITAEIATLTFQCIDLIKDLLETKEQLLPQQEQTYLQLQQHIASYLPESGTHEAMQETPQLNVSESKVNLFCIRFTPDNDVLMRGISIDSVFDELNGLGKYVSFDFQHEPTTDATPENHLFFGYFEIFIVTESAADTIGDVFMFFSPHEYTVETLNYKNATDLEHSFLQSLSVANGKTTIDDLMLQITNLLPDDIPQLALTTSDTAKATTTSSPQQATIRVAASKLDSLLTFIGELVQLHSQFENHAQRLGDVQLTKSVRRLNFLSKKLRDDVLATRLIPIDDTMIKMSRLIRDLSLKLGKQIEFIAEGNKTELDKTIINKIETPLIHLIRNCVDHGIESPDERVANQKTPHGVIRFAAFYSGINVFIHIQDDGRGINPDTILNKAIEKRMVASNAQLTRNEIYELIFLPGFSTKTEISDTSGRGVGMDVVKKEIQELRGEINIDSEIGLGTSFTIKLPLTLSIIDALLVHCGKYLILIPANSIVSCRMLPINYFDNKDMVYRLENKTFPVFELHRFFETPSLAVNNKQLIIVSVFDKLYGFVADTIVGNTQAVVKPLGHLHIHQSYFTGVSQLGDGRIAFILDTNHLVKFLKN